MVSSDWHCSISSPPTTTKRGEENDTKPSLHPSLDITIQNSTVDRPSCSTWISTWTPKQKRLYHRLLSGFKKRTNGERIRFMTLTTSDYCDYYSLGKHWSALQMRIIRRFKRFRYIKIMTCEGYGVLHIVFDGTYIPQKWLSTAWREIHDSPIVDIRSLPRTDNKRLARYLISHYLTKQSYMRMSWSWSWVYRGFVSRWNSLKQHYKDHALMMWQRHLDGNDIHNSDFILYSDGRITSIEQVTLA